MKEFPKDRAEKGRTFLSNLGFTSDVQQRMGAFVALWAFFESRLEASGLLTNFVECTRDLAAYRNAMLQGTLIPKGLAGQCF
jgi:hypothetical protein